MHYLDKNKVFIIFPGIILHFVDIIFYPLFLCIFVIINIFTLLFSKDKYSNNVSSYVLHFLFIFMFICQVALNQ